MSHYNPIIEALVHRRDFCFVGRSASAFEYKLWFSNQLTR